MTEFLTFKRDRHGAHTGHPVDQPRNKGNTIISKLAELRLINVEVHLQSHLVFQIPQWPMFWEVIFFCLGQCELPRSAAIPSTSWMASAFSGFQLRPGCSVQWNQVTPRISWAAAPSSTATAKVVPPFYATIINSCDRSVELRFQRNLYSYYSYISFILLYLNYTEIQSNYRRSAYLRDWLFLWLVFMMHQCDFKVPSISFVST